MRKIETREDNRIAGYWALLQVRHLMAVAGDIKFISANEYGSCQGAMLRCSTQ